ncbi:selenoprotein W-related protein [Kushneria avicenniae]|uniref:Selenoprotein W-related protein n=1 Tax=Kushneria avicenniae TaxID=402385 RepID=A0A1I1I8Q8_9GAMM|nr:SelT/SelW/SelH family protein [Kushneria avicenniae]SFC32431.1 selenoprotein W-related protein [Kushneria avicenniae]
MKVVIHYCTQCQWLLRAGWYAQELLSTFGEGLEQVSLAPGHGGHFEIEVILDDQSAPEVIWERKRDGGFPDIKELKRRVRDRLDPDRDLGHIDR